jgi:hypothetical protein
MSQGGALDRIEIRSSLSTMTAWVVAFVVFGAGTSFCTPSEADPSATPGASWLITGIVLVVGLVILARTATSRSPRIILDTTGIFWRDGSSKIYETLAWPEIVTASIEPGGEDEVKRLRLHLEPRPALESVATERHRRWVDISLDTVDIHERRLRRVINQLAPHLFTGAARDTPHVGSPQNP